MIVATPSQIADRSGAGTPAGITAADKGPEGVSRTGRR